MRSNQQTFYFYEPDLYWDCNIQDCDIFPVETCDQSFQKKRLSKVTSTWNWGVFDENYVIIELHPINLEKHLEIFLIMQLELQLKKVPWFSLAKSTSRKQFGAINKLYSRHFTSNNIQDGNKNGNNIFFQVWGKTQFHFKLCLR